MNNKQDYIGKTKLERLFSHPIFIVSAPRSGSTLLFSLLRQSSDIWTAGGEIHPVFSQFPDLKAENKNFDSGGLFARHADEKTSEKFKRLLVSMLINRDGQPLTIERMVASIPFLEKTPRNALNIEFILKVFPKARFIYLHRDPRENISSIMEAWELGARTGRFVTFSGLPGWSRGDWCLLLPPNWRQYNGKSLAEISAFQWQACNEVILRDLGRLHKSRWVSISYSALLVETEKSISRLCRFCSVQFDEVMKLQLEGELPLSHTVVSLPKKGKWRRHESEIAPLLAGLQSTIKKINSLSR